MSLIISKKHKPQVNVLAAAHSNSSANVKMNLFRKFILATIFVSPSLFSQTTFDNVSSLELCIDYINSPLNQSDSLQQARTKELTLRNESCQQYVELAKARKTNIVPEKSFLEKLGDALSGAGGNSNNRPITTNCTTFGNQVNCQTR